MLEGVARPVNSWSLAVPKAEYTVYRSAGLRFYLLRANEDGGGKIFVDCRLEMDVAGFKFRTASP